MKRQEAIEFGNIWLQINEDCKDSSTYSFFQMAIEALQKITMLENLTETYKQSGHAPTRTISMEDLRELLNEQLKESPENDSLIKSAYLIGQMCEKTDCNNCIFKFVDQGKWLSCIVSCRPYDWRRHIEDNFEERRTNDEGRRD